MSEHHQRRREHHRRVIRRDNRSASTEHSPPRRRAILVDAANVAFTNHDEPHARGSVDNILAMRRALVSLGYQPIFIADASLRYAVDHPELLNELEESGEILQAPAGTDADYFLLAYAERQGLPIVSNDVFRDRRDEFPEASRRRVPFMIVDGEVILEQEQLPASFLPPHRRSKTV